MAEALEKNIVRIRSADNKIAGAGFQVTNSWIVTCAHVVAQALGLPEMVFNMPEGHVNIDFPLQTGTPSFPATVIHWDIENDIAGLEFFGDVSVANNHLPLIQSDDLWGHKFRTFGFPSNYDNGVWTDGVLKSKTAQGLIQIEGLKTIGYEVKKGFSGSPIWDENLGGAVGMVLIADTTPGVKAAYMVDARKILTTWVDLSQEILNRDMELLRTNAFKADKPKRLERKRVINLRPLDMTHSFKDRLVEYQNILDHLNSDNVRLITVVGRGGIGKTALASHILTDIEMGIPGNSLIEKINFDGIIYLGARSTGLGLDRLFSDIGKMLGDPAAQRLSSCWADKETSLTSKTEILIESLQDGLYIFLLDNFEDYLSNNGNINDEGLRCFVESCLRQTGTVRLLLTSREDIKVEPSLLMNIRNIYMDNGLPENEAINLLRDLDPDGNLGLKDANDSLLRQAFQLTNGIPKALELIAGILNEDQSVSLEELLENKNLFDGRVIDKLVAEGYKRLGDRERKVMDALAVFNRPVNSTAISFLLHPWFPGLDVKTSLSRLVNSHFVSVNRSNGTFSLHPIDRAHAYLSIPDERSEK